MRALSFQHLTPLYIQVHSANSICSRDFVGGKGFSANIYCPWLLRFNGPFEVNRECGVYAL